MTVTLAPYQGQCLELLCEWRMDPVMRRYNPVEALQMDAFHERLSEAGADFAEFKHHDLFFWMIRSGDEPVGNISVRNINRRMLIAEIGYAVSAPARGKGCATAAVQLVTEMAFRKTPLRKLIAFVHEENQASRRVLEKTGYQEEGLLREHYLINGIPVNEIIYGILRSDLP